MEENQLLDVPITQDEIRKKAHDRQRLLIQDEARLGRNPPSDPEIRRFRSLQAPTRSLKSSLGSSRSSAGHQRIPSHPNEDPIEWVETTRSGNYAHSHTNSYASPATHYTREFTQNHLDHSPQLWMPIWLKKPVIVLFLILYLLIIVALALLWHFSHSRQGFDIDHVNDQYAWTYVPTLLMVILVGFWRQVDYYTKLLAPWDELRRGPVAADRSLLLDYISPINVLSLFAALKRGYIPIIVTVIGFFCLKVMVIFSAASFVVLPTAVVTTANGTLSHAFGSSTISQRSVNGDFTFTPDTVYSAVGQAAYGLPFQLGLQSEYAYLPVALDRSFEGNVSGVTYSTQTEAFYPNIACDAVNVTILGDPTVHANRTTAKQMGYQINLQIPNDNICSNWIQPNVHAMNPQQEATPPRQIQGTMQPVYCADDENLEPMGLLYTMTEIQYTRRTQRGVTLNSTRTVSKMANLLCITSYNLFTANITNNTILPGGNGVDISPVNRSDKTLEPYGVTDRTMARLFSGVMNASQGIFGTREDDPQAPEIPTTPFNLMALAINETSIQSLFNLTLMSQTAKSTFRSVMSHYAMQNFVQPSPSNQNVTVSYTKDRLHVNDPPFYVMLVGFVMLVFCSGILLVTSPGPLVPKDPTMIATSAVILARSPELNRILRKQQTLNMASMTNVSSNAEFGTAIATTDQGKHSFKLIVSEVDSHAPVWRTGPIRPWWTPNFLLLPAFAQAVIIPLVLIALLEVVQRMSDHSSGLFAVADNANTTTYMRCIPVLIFTLLAAMVSVLNFYVELFTPWNKLSVGNASARRSLLSQLLGKLPPMAFIEAIRSRHFAAILSIAAAVIASMFAVIASNLYSVVIFNASGLSQQMINQNYFDVSYGVYQALNDNGAAGFVRTSLSSNLPLAEGTFRDIVLSRYWLDKVENRTELQSITGPFKAQLPAVRANLRCDPISSNDFNVSYHRASRKYNSDHYTVDIEYALPDTCHKAGPYGNGSTLRFTNEFNVTNKADVLYGGKLYDLLFGENASLVDNYGEHKAAQVGDNEAIGCPSLAFTFARFEANLAGFQVAPMVCYQEIQQMNTNFTFYLNSTTINPDYEYAVDESTVKTLTNPNSSIGARTFDWRIQGNLDRQLYGLDNERLEALDSGVTYGFDAFFSFVFKYVYSGDPASWFDPAHNGTMFNATNQAYRIYMAQAINGNMRKPSSEQGGSLVARQSSSTDTAKMLLQATEPRLVQNKTSKLVLQILLGLATLLSILAYTLTRFHRLLPCNPCSIAGTMSLLAGSDLCYSHDDSICDCCGKPRRTSWDIQESNHSGIPADPNDYHVHSVAREEVIPDKAEWMSDIQFAGLFAGKTYSMGWWREDQARLRRRRFGIDVGGRPDSDMDREWALGSRGRPVQQQGFEGFMMRTMDMMGDNRGTYERAYQESFAGSYQGSEHGSEDEHARPVTPPATSSANLQPAFESPQRRVRFEDEHSDFSF